jgi:hypothetical protein
MSIGADLSGLSHAQKDALIGALMAQVAALTARIAELEAKLGLPPKTPDNSSVPPSKGQKPSESSTPKDKAKPHAGAHRPLHPNPTAKRDVFACRCQGWAPTCPASRKTHVRPTIASKSLRSSPT